MLENLNWNKLETDVIERIQMMRLAWLHVDPDQKESFEKQARQRLELLAQFCKSIVYAKIEISDKPHVDCQVKWNPQTDQKPNQN